MACHENNCYNKQLFLLGRGKGRKTRTRHVPSRCMKRIQFCRHSIKQGPGDTDLSDAGIRLAQRIGSSFLRGKNFSQVFTSSLKRTRDTAVEFMRGAGDFPQLSLQVFPPGADAGGTEEAMNLWGGVCNEAEHAGQDMLQAALQKEGKVAHEIAEMSAASFKKWIASLPDGANVLVVGHSPFLELMVYGLFGIVLPQLLYCEGFIITEDCGVLRLESPIRS